MSATWVTGEVKVVRWRVAAVVSKEYAMLTLASLGLLAYAGLGTLFWLAIVFFIIALVAWALGAGGMAGMSAGIGRMLLFVFLVLAIIFIILNFTVGGPAV
jgi:uncharacterized membrane protein YtjA (UPF0391 family)